MIPVARFYEDEVVLVVEALSCDAHYVQLFKNEEIVARWDGTPPFYKVDTPTEEDSYRFEAYFPDGSIEFTNNFVLRMEQYVRGS